MGEREPRIRPEILQLNRYIPGKPIDEVVRELGLSSVVKLASNENPLGPSPKALEAATRALRSMQLYPDDSAYNLKKALSAHHKIDGEHFIQGNGAVEIIRMIVELFIEPGDEAVLGAPSFAIYRQDVKQMGGKLVEVPLDETFHYDLAAIRKAVTAKTKLIALCSPNNPTGTIIRKPALDAFLRDLPRDIFVVLDEAYGDFAGDPEYHNGIDYVLQGYPVIALRTFSKAYGLAGLRVGYGVASKSVAANLNRLRVLFDVSGPAQAAAVAALSDSEHYEKTRRLIREEKPFLYGELKRLGVRFVPTESNFFVVETADDWEAFQALLRLGVIVRPGSHLGMPGWLRITIGTREENSRLIAALEKTLHKCGA